MKTKSHSKIGIALCRLNSDSAAAFQLFPAGEFRASDGRPKDCPFWIVEDPAALIADAKARANDFLVDYEHQSMLSAQNGQPAPAAGWFSGAELEWRDDGMYVVSAKWTERAIAYIKAGEYLFVSPVFVYDKLTGKVLKLLSVALTNTPALDGMQAVMAASLMTQQDTPMDLLAKLIAQLGLPEGSDDAAVEEVVKQLQQAAADAAAAAAKDKPIDKTADPAACKDTVTTDVNTDLAKEVISLRAEMDADKVQRLITDNAAKLPTPGLKKWAKTQSFAALKEFLADAPEIAALTQSQTGGKQPDGKDTGIGMDAEQLAILKLTGVSPELITKYGAK